MDFGLAVWHGMCDAGAFLVKKVKSSWNGKMVFLDTEARIGAVVGFVAGAAAVVAAVGVVIAVLSGV